MPSKRLWQKLDEYQRNAVEFVLSQKGCGLFFEQGTGKTWITGGVIESLLGPEFEALIVVPLSNKVSTWEHLLQSELPELHVVKSLQALTQAPFPRALLLHYEEVPKLVQRLRKRFWTLIVYDESHRLKDRASLTSRTAAKLRDSAQYKVALSGTPIDERPTDLWAQFRFFAPHVFGVRWKDFEDEFLERVEFNPHGYREGSLRYQRELRNYLIRKSKRKMREDKFPEFLARIKPYALRVDKSVLNLPPMHFVEDYVKLRGFQRKLYQELERDMISRVLNVTAPLKITQRAKLQQITGGFVFDDDGNVLEVGRAKLRRVKRILKRYGAPLVVFARFRAEVAVIAEELREMGFSVATLTGATKRDERPSIIKRFQAGKLDVIVCQVKTGGVGIDLYRANRMVVYSTSESFIDFDQMINRVHRRGQENDVYIHLLIAEDTIDTALFLALRRKENASDRVLNYLRRKNDGKSSKEERSLQEDGAGRVQVHSREPRKGPGHTTAIRPDRSAQTRGRKGGEAVWLEFR